MELIGEKYCSNRKDHIQKVEPGNLLEECWFFGNLLNSGATKTKMSRCNSDPCPSSNYNSQEEMFVRNDGKCSCPSTKKHPTRGDNFVGPKLARAPSLPSCMARAVEVNQEKETTLDFSQGIKPNIGSSSSSSLRNSLIRAPSLPPPSCVGREEEDDDDEEEEDQESEFTLGRLIRQASLNSSDILPPRQPSKSSTIPTRKHRPRKKDMEGYKEMGQQYQTNQKKMAKSPSNLQPKEAQYFMAFSLKSDNQSLKLDGPNKVSGLQDMGKEKLRRSSSLSDASLYLNKRSATTIPNWATAAAAATDNEKKSANDMKAQIKFWARAVASNARAPGVLITNQNC